MLELAVIGAGHWGPNLIRNFHNQTRSRVRWVVDLHEERLEATRSHFPGVNVTRDLTEALDDARVDALAIATPTSTHAGLARMALESGRHVMVEKPLTGDSKSSRELCQLARQEGRVLLVGHVFLFNPAVRWVKDRIDARDLGRTYYISSERTNLGPIRQDVNAAWDLAAQDIAIFNYWLGGPPTGVTAVGHDWVNRGVQDAVFATLRYPDQILVHLHVSWLNPCKVRRITVVADKKMLTYDDMNELEPIRLFDKKVVEEADDSAFVDTFEGFRSVVHNGDITIPPVRMGEPLQAECMHFLDCIESGSQPLCGGEEGLAVVLALEALDRSAANGGREESV